MFTTGSRIAHWLKKKTTKDKQNAMKEEEQQKQKQNHIREEEEEEETDAAVVAPLDNIEDINSTTLARPFSWMVGLDGW